MIKTRRKDYCLEVIIPHEWENFTLQTLLKSYWKLPKKMIHEWRMTGNVLIEGAAPRWNDPLTDGQTLSLPFFMPEEESKTAEPRDLGIQILYEDDHLLIANKPAGLGTHPSEPGDTRSLLNGAAYYLHKTNQNMYIKHVHRLDKDTTGAVLFAKNKASGAMLDRLLEERKIKRTYLALCEGSIRENSGRIAENIGRDRHHATRRRVSPSGQPAVTHFKVIERYPKKNLTLISCTLETGRTHQIRVHMSHIGHPLAGDRLYGGKASVPRQALHAARLDLIHPVTEEKISVEAPFLDKPPIFPAGLPSADS